jgi:hypothetical protein
VVEDDENSAEHEEEHYSALPDPEAADPEGDLRTSPSSDSAASLQCVEPRAAPTSVAPTTPATATCLQPGGRSSRVPPGRSPFAACRELGGPTPSPTRDPHAAPGAQSSGMGGSSTPTGSAEESVGSLGSTFSTSSENSLPSSPVQSAPPV